ncbi:xanthine dehydrogenase accessory protein XdhC [Niveibacterium umoris]|uniref:Xanthine dehydrogenase accessory factor n=1 Tax=Niveibacterium umoris TaxID=1193620 RepID=A0A840BH59_9RHOO|nr:xanthine dehydrogenase accessory protein XdhC [Niveibacterium umoris]MBB4011564.1 xanthine dehydrogenase accessory factor [Niveibacterium umoris]
MNEWLNQIAPLLAADGSLMLITVVMAQGSTPREAGAAMVVSARQTADTIGGGHLEWEATAIARALLRDGTRLRTVRFSLGASLGQCCGGAVWLLFERIEPDSALMWRHRAAALARGEHLARTVASIDVQSTWSLLPSGHAHARFARDPDGSSWQFQQQIGEPPFPICIFGAGHVGEALVRVLAPLGAQIDWIDPRDDVFPAGLPANVRTHCTDAPEQAVADAPPGTCFIVLTHSHALDFELCLAIYRRKDFAYFGLIGSATKRAKFEHRLIERGIAPERMDELTCPIGIDGIQSKLPQSIAIGVAAQLLQLRETRMLLQHASQQAASVFADAHCNANGTQR